MKNEDVREPQAPSVYERNALQYWFLSRGYYQKSLLITVAQLMSLLKDGTECPQPLVRTRCTQLLEKVIQGGRKKRGICCSVTQLMDYRQQQKQIPRAATERQLKRYIKSLTLY